MDTTPYPNALFVHPYVGSPLIKLGMGKRVRGLLVGEETSGHRANKGQTRGLGRHLKVKSAHLDSRGAGCGRDSRKPLLYTPSSPSKDNLMML